MPEQWNKYGPTAARKHGKPGREVRPKSVTIDIHAHVDVPAAARNFAYFGELVDKIDGTVTATAVDAFH